MKGCISCKKFFKVNCNGSKCFQCLKKERRRKDFLLRRNADAIIERIENEKLVLKKALEDEINGSNTGGEEEADIDDNEEDGEEEESDQEESLDDDRTDHTDFFCDENSDDETNSSAISVYDTNIDSTLQQDNTDMSGSDEDSIYDITVCMNCRRTELMTDDYDCYRLRAQWIDRCHISTGRSFAFVTPADTVNGKFYLCIYCRQYLDKESTLKEYRVGAKMWPSYLRKLLEDTKSNTKRRIWQLLPRIVQDQYRHNVSDELKENYVSCSVDITLSSKILQHELESSDICNIRKGLNRLNPEVLCPYGCSTYLHKTGYIDLEAVFQMLTREENIPTMFGLTKVTSGFHIRKDYYREILSLYGTIGINDEWKVLPSLKCLPDKGLVFMTCPEHNEGGKSRGRLRYFHIPRTPFLPLIPSKHADQLCYGVVRPRIATRMKRSEYGNTTHEILTMQGKYGGIDSCSIGLTSNFTVKSSLLHQRELGYLNYRTDIRALLHSQVERFEIDPNVAEMKLRRSKDTIYKNNADDCLRGATFMTVHDSVTFLEDMNKYKEILFHGESKYPLWPEHRTFVHPCNCNYGSEFGYLPKLALGTDGSDTLWALCSILLCCTEMYNAAVDKCRIGCSKDDFEPNILTYISNNCFGYTFSSPRKAVLKGIQKCPSVKKLIEAVKTNAVPLHDTPDYFSSYSNYISIRVTSHQQWPSSLAISGALNGFMSSATRNPHKNVTLCINICGSAIVQKRWNELCFSIELHNNKKYELTYCLFETFDEHGNSNLFVRCRHGSVLHPEWWEHNRSQYIPIQVSDSTRQRVIYPVLLFYTEYENQSMKDTLTQYLRHIGIQQRVICATHNLPLSAVPSTTKTSLRCYQINEQGIVCGTPRRLICPYRECKTWICQKCFEKLPKNEQKKIDYVGSISAEQEDELRNFRFSACNEETNSWLANKAVNDAINEDTLEEDGYHDEIDYSSPNQSWHTPSGLKPPVSVVGATSESYEPSSIPGHVLLNRFGSLLIRQGSDLHGNVAQKHLQTQFACCIPGVSIPTLYLSGMLFPSVYWHSEKDGSISGCIPSCILAQESTVRSNGFASLQDHVQTGITSVDCLSGSCHRHKGFSHDALSNIALNGRHSQIVLCRTNTQHDVGAYATNNRFVVGAINSKKIIRELSVAEKALPSSIFLTLTCNQKLQPGVSHLRNMINNSRQWFNTNYKRLSLSIDSAEEFEAQLDVGMSGIILRNWLETLDTLVDYFQREDVLGTVIRIFVRLEYQDCGKFLFYKQYGSADSSTRQSHDLCQPLNNYYYSRELAPRTSSNSYGRKPSG